MEEIVAKEIMEDYLEDIYYDGSHPAGYGTARDMYNQSQVDGRNYSYRDIKDWLETQETFTIFRQLPDKQISRPRVVVPQKQFMYDSDTCNMVRYEKSNNGYKYILFVIDILSRFCFSFPLKSLTGKEVARHLTSLLKSKPCKFFRNDGGSEYSNKWVKDLFKNNGITQITTKNQTKAAFAERLIKTIKSVLRKYMYASNTFKWHDKLADVTHGYNHSYHRIIKMSPIDALKTEDSVLWRNQYLPTSKSRKLTKPKYLRKDKRKKQIGLYKFNIGDTVRLARYRNVFTRAYDENFTHEVFTITTRSYKQGIPVYTIKDFANDSIDGVFYEPELLKTKVNSDTVYKIEKLIRKKIIKGKKHWLVKWWGWPKKFNSFVPDEDIKDLQID